LTEVGHLLLQSIQEAEGSVPDFRVLKEQLLHFDFAQPTVTKQSDLAFKR
jgi:hypothetical protein